MTLNARLDAMGKLGERLQSLQPGEKEELFSLAQSRNAWFTPEQISLAWGEILKMLDRERLGHWAARYNLQPAIPKKVGVVMAGNIPMVGFHDFLCVVVSGHKLVAKLSSQDSVLLRFVTEELKKIAPEFEEAITFQDRLNNMDAVIATGSDNTSRYFEYYFRNIPHLIRKNRSSCAVIEGEETPAEFTTLGKDVFSYFGLGCRNISKLYVPEEFYLPELLKSWEGFSDIGNHHKYANNYDYNKSIYLVKQIPFLDTGFVLLTESDTLVSPIAVVYYERYKTLDDLASKLDRVSEKLQCVVSAKGWYKGSVPFGDAQCPSLSDYADHVDTMKFLESI